MTNLLFPTDFTANTRAAQDWVQLLAHKTGATVTLLHVYQPMIPDTTFPTVGGISEPGLGAVAAIELEDLSRQRLSELADQLRADGLSIKLDWRIGLVDDSILEAAREHSADLIVMGRSDLSTFFDRLAGSAVSDVADEARCPVLIVPTDPDGVAIHPVQVRTIAYAMQSQTTRALVEYQTETLVKAFDAQLLIVTEDKLDTIQADLIVMQLYRQEGLLDKLLHPNPVGSLIEKSEVPVLVYHQLE
ncbi:MULTISPECIES: universal stress protein [unclassified Spirosoma]|uniref:universal stress protein n=1 Tax=unclassified Spirosoma TaxID=2621999 RepID=UPI0009696D6C|nr:MULTISPECIES: universal stress protein [unclassified Spirosoma]MBN8822089.1 universal stress protein [Spirosoma sp.]OJW80490.1 MAG: universal stress protein UspA [Spirosoma sp. 48-14]